MFIFNVLLTHEFCSPKSQFVKYQCLFSMYYHYVNSTVLSHNSQNVNVCVLSMYYNVLLMYFSPEKGGKPYSKVSLLSDAWPSAETLWNSSESSKIHFIRPQIPRMMQNSHHLFIHYTLCFRCLPRQRTLRNSSESSEIHSICPQIRRITRNSHKNSSAI